ncbi:hypothetical protein BKA66DRAFT_605070 [Pyrenochaeta sp. MPI-SDFR-AT-0127]|nr:hypothetical protein BKA66DRAFT_605070 [Pyrenochaeta sp. MPI-SDFR-AT-0127]
MAPPDIKKTTRSMVPSEKDYRVNKRQTNRVTRSQAAKLGAMANHNYNSPLLRLPGEIRNKIYEYTLGDAIIYPTSIPYLASKEDILPRCLIQYHSTCTRIDTGTSVELPWSMSRDWSLFTALTRVCRQLYHETSTLPFKLNVMVLYAIDDVNAWLAQLKDDKKKAIQAIELIDLGYFKSDLLVELLTECSGLQTIEESNHVVGCNKDFKEDLEQEGFQCIKWHDGPDFGTSYMKFQRA